MHVHVWGYNHIIYPSPLHLVFGANLTSVWLGRSTPLKLQRLSLEKNVILVTAINGSLEGFLKMCIPQERLFRIIVPIQVSQAGSHILRQTQMLFGGMK